MASRPNILLIITHDTGRFLGCYGRGVETPHLDRLAADGVRLDRAFCTAPQCSPSRVSILTGRAPQEVGMHGLVGDGFSVPDAAETLPKRLKAAGYSTHIFGFQHENDNRPAALGYDHDHIPHGEHEVPKFLAAHITPRLCDWLGSRPAGPWMAAVGFFETHIPFPDWPAAAVELERVRPPAWLPDQPALRHDTAMLHRSIRLVDDCVGRIMDALAAAGQADDTIVVFTTDHGIAMPRAKGSMFDPGLEVAMLLRWPRGLPTNRVASAMVSNADLAPSLCQLAGLDGCIGSGVSFAPLLAGGAWRPRDELCAGLSWHGGAYAPQRCIRTERWKLIRRWGVQPADVLPQDYWSSCAGGPFLKPLFAQPEPELALYDLAADPHEFLNLAGRPWFADRVADLSGRLEAWMRRVGDPLLAGPIPHP